LQPPAAEGMGLEPFAKVFEKAGLEVEMVRCLDDNYCPIFRHAASNTVFLVDTPHGATIQEALDAKGWTPTHILITHHHWDHTGGNEHLKNWCPSVRILGPKDRTVTYANQKQQEELIPCMDQAVSEGDVVEVGGLKAKILEVGGHTDGHVAYWFSEVPMLMSGDALFNMGCGRVFTGNHAQMQESMAKFNRIPDDTIVFCAHEYTQANCKFALEVQPDNPAVAERAAVVEALRERGLATVPTLMGHEKATNPFLRYESEELQAQTGLKDPLEVFTLIRKWKNDGGKPKP